MSSPSSEVCKQELEKTRHLKNLGLVGVERQVEREKRCLGWCPVPAGPAAGECRGCWAPSSPFPFRVPCLPLPGAPGHVNDHEAHAHIYTHTHNTHAHTAPGSPQGGKQVVNTGNAIHATEMSGTAGHLSPGPTPPGVRLETGVPGRATRVRGSQACRAAGITGSPLPLPGAGFAALRLGLGLRMRVRPLPRSDWLEAGGRYRAANELQSPRRLRARPGCHRPASLAAPPSWAHERKALPRDGPLGPRPGRPGCGRRPPGAGPGWGGGGRAPLPGERFGGLTPPRSRSRTLGGPTPGGCNRPGVSVRGHTGHSTSGTPQGPVWDAPPLHPPAPPRVRGCSSRGLKPGSTRWGPGHARGDPRVPMRM